MTTEKKTPELTITSKQVVNYQSLTVLCKTPMSQSELVVTLQNLIVALVNAQLGEVAAKQKAAEQGKLAASALSGSMAEARSMAEVARALGLPDRRRAPLRKVTWCRKGSNVNKLECGHEFRVPSGHEKVAKKRRCVECLAEKSRA